MSPIGMKHSFIFHHMSFAWHAAHLQWLAALHTSWLPAGSLRGDNTTQQQAHSILTEKHRHAVSPSLTALPFKQQIICYLPSNISMQLIYECRSLQLWLLCSISVSCVLRGCRTEWGFGCRGGRGGRGSPARGHL